MKMHSEIMRQEDFSKPGVCIYSVEPHFGSFIERNHRIVKKVAEQFKISKSETMYWYNVSIDKEREIPMSN